MNAKEKAFWLEGKKPFKVKDAYNLAMAWHTDNSWKVWRCILKMKFQHRVRIFTWLLAHGCLLTNPERTRRHISSNLLCTRYQLEEEDDLHALRDCYKARQT